MGIRTLFEVVTGKVLQISGSSFDLALIASGSGVLKQNTVIDLLTSDTTDEKQAKIDAVPRFALPNVSVTFQFEDGAHTESGTLKFENFLYTTYVLGNAAEDEDVLHTNQAVQITSTDPIVSIEVRNCADIVFHNLKVTSGAATPFTFLVSFSNCTVKGCYTLDSLSGNSFGTSKGLVKAIYGKHTLQMLEFRNGCCMSSIGNDDTGSVPFYGINCVGSFVAKSGTQPAGLIAAEQLDGGLIS